MAAVKNEEEEEEKCALTAKRKPDITSVEKYVGEDKEENDPKKKQKLETSSKINSSLAEEKQIDKAGDTAEEEEDDEDEEDYEDGEDEEEDDENDDDEHSNGEAEIDRKGKGILREDKGKGKLIEESEDSSDDDGIESDGDNDLSDDPLAEVDLDNILPSRTRRRTVHPGVYIANDLGKDDDSDDSDA